MESIDPQRLLAAIKSTEAALTSPEGAVEDTILAHSLMKAAVQVMHEVYPAESKTREFMGPFCLGFHVAMKYLKED